VLDRDARDLLAADLGAQVADDVLDFRELGHGRARIIALRGADQRRFLKTFRLSFASSSTPASRQRAAMASARFASERWSVTFTWSPFTFSSIEKLCSVSCSSVSATSVRVLPSRSNVTFCSAMRFARPW